MNAGIWKIATAKLCGQCIRDMEDEYIFAPQMAADAGRHVRTVRRKPHRPRGAVHDEQTRAGEKRETEWA